MYLVKKINCVNSNNSDRRKGIPIRQNLTFLRAPCLVKIVCLLPSRSDSKYIYIITFSLIHSAFPHHLRWRRFYVWYSEDGRKWFCSKMISHHRPSLVATRRWFLLAILDLIYIHSTLKSHPLFFFLCLILTSISLYQGWTRETCWTYLAAKIKQQWKCFITNLLIFEGDHSSGKQAYSYNNDI